MGVPNFRGSRGETRDSNLVNLLGDMGTGTLTTWRWSSYGHCPLNDRTTRAGIVEGAADTQRISAMALGNYGY